MYMTTHQKENSEKSVYSSCTMLLPFFFFYCDPFSNSRGAGGDALCALLPSLHTCYQLQTPKSISLLTVVRFYPLFTPKLGVLNAILSLLFHNLLLFISGFFESLKSIHLPHSEVCEALSPETLALH